MAISILQLSQSCKDFYGIQNDACPICKDKYTVPCNLVKIGDVGFHLDCYEKTVLRKDAK